MPISSHISGIANFLYYSDNSSRAEDRPNEYGASGRSGQGGTSSSSDNAAPKALPPSYLRRFPPPFIQMPPTMKAEASNAGSAPAIAVKNDRNNKKGKGETGREAIDAFKAPPMTPPKTLPNQAPPNSVSEAMEPSRVCMNNDLDEMGNYNLTGLRELNMPGIEQFSEGMFDEIQKAASSKKDVVFDTEKNFMNLFMVGLSLGSSLVIRIRGMWIRAWMKLFRKYGKKSRKSGLKK